MSAATCATGRRAEGAGAPRTGSSPHQEAA